MNSRKGLELRVYGLCLADAKLLETRGDGSWPTSLDSALRRRRKRGTQKRLQRRVLHFQISGGAIARRSSLKITPKCHSPPARVVV